MTNTPNSTPERTYYSNHLDLACEQLADELQAECEQHEQTRRELRWATDTNRAAVDIIRKLTLTIDRDREINRRLRIELKKLRDALLDSQVITANHLPGGDDEEPRPSLPC